MQKSVLIFGLAVVAIIVMIMGSVTYVLFDIDGLIKSEVETTASRAFKGETTLAEANMSLKTGEAKLIGLRIPNPAGFTSGIAVQVPEIAAAVDTSKGPGPVVTVAAVVMDRPEVSLEIADGNANLIRLADSARALARQAKAGADKDVGVQRFRIDSITLQNGSMTFQADSLGSATVKIPLPDTRITDIGGEEGVSSGELSSVMMEIILTATERATRRIDLEKMAKEAGVSVPDIDFAKMFGRDAAKPALVPNQSAR